MPTYNFNAGPAALPKAVLQQVQHELLDFQNTGMSILEMSHRGAVYEAVHNQAQQTLRELLNISEDYAVLFMGSGARAQFALVAMNLLAPLQHADYLVTGVWAEQAAEEASKVGDVRVLFSGKASRYARLPTMHEVHPSADAAYLHYTSNNTVYGTQLSYVPEAPANVPLVCDMSSDILTRTFDVSRFGLIYAGAQKNMGPAGVTVVIVRQDLLERSPEKLPEIFSYKKVAEANSLLNTPPVFAIYMTGLVCQWVKEQGGVKVMQARSEQKAKLLYDCLDTHADFYIPNVQTDSRSHINVTFHLPTTELEKKFLSAADQAGFVGLKGHRVAGGIRVSLYNAVELSQVQALVDFMQAFARS